MEAPSPAQLNSGRRTSASGMMIREGMPIGSASTISVRFRRQSAVQTPIQPTGL
jgi:hypothetical protein